MTRSRVSPPGLCPLPSTLPSEGQTYDVSLTTVDPPDTRGSPRSVGGTSARSSERSVTTGPIRHGPLDLCVPDLLPTSLLQSEFFPGTSSYDRPWDRDPSCLRVRVTLYRPILRDLKGGKGGEGLTDGGPRNGFTGGMDR